MKTSDYKIAFNFWIRGIDWCVMKVGKKWALLDCFGEFPLFATKKAAYEAADKFIEIRSHESY